MSLAGRLGENRATHVFSSKIKVLPSDKRPALITAKRGVTQTSSWWDLICVRQNLFKSFPKTKVLAALDAGWKPIGLLSAVLPPARRDLWHGGGMATGVEDFPGHGAKSWGWLLCSSSQGLSEPMRSLVLFSRRWFPALFCLLLCAPPPLHQPHSPSLSSPPGTARFHTSYSSILPLAFILFWTEITYFSFFKFFLFILWSN